MVVTVLHFANVTGNDRGPYSWLDSTPRCHREWNPGVCRGSTCQAEPRVRPWDAPVTPALRRSTLVGIDEAGTMFGIGCWPIVSTGMNCGGDTGLDPRLRYPSSPCARGSPNCVTTRTMTVSAKARASQDASGTVAGVLGPTRSIPVHADPSRSKPAPIPDLAHWLSGWRAMSGQMDIRVLEYRRGGTGWTESGEGPRGTPEVEKAPIYEAAESRVRRSPRMLGPASLPNTSPKQDNRNSAPFGAGSPSSMILSRCRTGHDPCFRRGLCRLMPVGQLEFAVLSHCAAPVPTDLPIHQSRPTIGPLHPFNGFGRVRTQSAGLPRPLINPDGRTRAAPTASGTFLFDLPFTCRARRSYAHSLHRH